MKKLFALLLALMMVLSLVACGQTAPSDDGSEPNQDVAHDPIELSFAVFHAETSLDATEFIIPWQQAIVDKCAELGYELSFDNYWSETLCAVPDSYQTVLSGTADMAMFLPSMTGLFPLEDVVFFPQNGSDLAHGSRLLQDLYFKYPEMQAEWADVHLVGLVMETPQYTMTNKKFTTLAESNGMIWNSTGAICTSILDKFGWGSVSAGPADIYSYMERNTLDGCGSSAKNIMSNSWYEVADYIVSFVMTYNYEGIAMNTDTWNNLPEEVQAVFNEFGNTSDPTNYYLADMYDSALLAIEEDYLGRLSSEYGMEWVELPEETVTEMQALVDEAADAWAVDMDANGMPGSDIIKTYRELIVKYSD